MISLKHLPLILGSLFLVLDLNFVIAKSSPSTSSKDPFNVSGATNTNDGKTTCISIGMPQTANARSTSTTSSNRPIAGYFFPSYLASKAVIVLRTLTGGRGQVVSQSDFTETTRGNTSSLPVSITYEFNCSIFQIGDFFLGYGYHKALPSADDPTPTGGNKVIYSENSGSNYTYQPW